MGIILGRDRRDVLGSTLMLPRLSRAIKLCVWASKMCHVDVRSGKWATNVKIKLIKQNHPSGTAFHYVISTAVGLPKVITENNHSYGSFFNFFFFFALWASG